MVSANALSRAALLGIATGSRSMTPLATLSWAASSGRISLPDSFPFSLLARRSVSNVLFLFTAVEFVGDKLPSAGARTAPGPLLGRTLFGALVGATGFAIEEEPIALGAVVGGLFAAGGSFAGLGVRTRLTDAGVPKFLAAVTEDMLAVGLAVFAVLQRRGRVR
jgi:uncharacterized membrane protein